MRKHFEGRGIVNSDPPAHTRLRKLANKAFTPAMVESLRPKVEAIVKMLLDRVEDGQPFDIIGALAFPLPTIVIAEMLGAPREDREHLKNWSENITSFQQAGKVVLERAERAQQSILELTDYFRALIQERRKTPKDDLLSALAAVSEDGETLSDSDLFDTCVTLLIAGHETTTSLIGNGMLELLKDPEQMELLRADPGLIRSAVEEMLRFHSPVLAMHRRVAKDVTLRGRQISSGDLLYMILAAANRDPEVFFEPNHFNIRRPVAENKHIAFGYGIHFCLGAPLARLEAPIAVQALLTRFPRLRLDGEPKWKANMMVRFLEHLPVRP
jgi:cytochrome P450